MTRTERRRRNSLPPLEDETAKRIDSTLLTIASDPGIVAVAFLDAENGALLGSRSAGDGAVESTRLTRPRFIPSVLDAMRDLSQADELDDVVVTFAAHCHVARIVRSSRERHMVAYAIVDRRDGSVTLTRLKLWEAARRIAA